MKAVRQTAAALWAAALLVLLFFTALQVGIFNMRYIDREMEKLNIAEKIEMESEDLHALFKETLAYLSDDREDLVIQTVVNGEAREAYNEREKLHMVDVKRLFDGGFQTRNAALFLTIIMLLTMFVFRKKASWKTVCKESARSIVCVWGIFLVVFAIVLALIAMDFNRYFIMFHHLFFDNDLWILDPDTSLMINMLPEQFFYDTVMRVGMLFAVPFAGILTGCVVIWCKMRRKRTV